MASEQQQNTTNEREVREPEQGRVPKMVTKFDAIAVQVKDSDITAGKDIPFDSKKDHHTNSHGGTSHDARSANTIGDVGDIGKARETHERADPFSSLETKKYHQSHEERTSGRSENKVGSVDGAGKGREAHERASPFVSEDETRKDHRFHDPERSAEKARETHERETPFVSLADRTKNEENRGKESQGREYEEGKQGRDQTTERGPYTVRKFEMITEHNKGASDWDRSSSHSTETQKINKGTNQAGKGEGHDEETRKELPTQHTKQHQSRENNEQQQQQQQQPSYVSEETSQAKDTLSQGPQYASETAEGAKEKTKQTGSTAKETLVSVAKTAKDYTAPIAVKAKDVAVSAGKKAADYTGKFAGGVKDRAPAAGWTAAHYTTEKAVEGTKLVASTVKDAAEYAGHKAAEIASKSFSAAKDVAVSTGEGSKDYTAMKKEVAQREYPNPSLTNQDTESNKPGQTESKLESRTDESKREEGKFQRTSEENVEVNKARPSELNRSSNQDSTDQWERSEYGEGKGSEVLSAIGETIVEIAQTTKNLVIGESDRSNKDNVGKSQTS